MLHIVHSNTDRAVWSIPILNKRNILALYKSHVFSSWTFCSQVSFSAPRCFLHEKIAPENRTNKYKLLSKSEQDPITEREVRSNLLVRFFNDLHGTQLIISNRICSHKTRRDQSALQRSMKTKLQESDIVRARFARKDDLEYFCGDSF